MSFGEIFKGFGGKLIGNPLMKSMVCEAVVWLPKDIQNYVTKNVWFLSSPDDAWALTFRGSDIKNQHLIFLSDELFKQKRGQIIYTIIHEIGHVILGHENSMGRKQTQSEIRWQELEAHRFAKKYLLS